MIVMKFGGTSVEDAKSIQRVAGIIEDRIDRHPVVVVSAMGKTTRKLLQAAEASAAGDGRTTISLVAELKTRHLSEARRLIHAAKGSDQFDLIEQHFDELKKLLEGLAVLGEVPPRGLDKILSYGELLSSVIVSGALNRRGLPARLLDSREFIKTDDRYGGASPLFELTNQRTAEIVRPAIERGEIPVVQGFIGSTRNGATTTLGFEGSDYTAAIIGAALSASDIQIWKDVSGLMTADPAVFTSARTVKACSYAEAAELTYFGAKVLHPKAIYPAAQGNIPVHIYNSREPSATGTAISAGAGPCANAIKSIAYKRPVSLIRLEFGLGYERAASTSEPAGREILPGETLLQFALDRCGRRRIIPLIVTSTSSVVVMAVDSGAVQGDSGRDLLEEFGGRCRVSLEPNRAIVSVVGEQMHVAPGLAASMLRAVDGLELGMVLQGASPIAMNLVIKEGDVEDAISRLHEMFFKQIDPAIFE
jgi:aspartate kinase